MQLNFAKSMKERPLFLKENKAMLFTSYLQVFTIATKSLMSKILT